MRIIIDSDIPHIKGILEPYAEVEYLKGTEINTQSVRHCDALIVRTRTKCNEALLGGSQVKIIATATIGTDHIDLDYCHRSGIEICNAKGCNARGVLQWVAAALRHITLTDNKQPSNYRLGIVGVGSVGSLVAKYARHWGFSVMECDPPRQEREGGKFYPIDKLAEECDILTFHTPLNNTTHHLLNKSLLNKLRPDAVILNASRGGVVDNLAVANSSHRYYFDVWENEPNITPDVLHKATLATPHIAGYSKQGKANATTMAIRSLASFFGLPLMTWHPAEVEPTTPKDISWQELCSTIDRYCPISQQTQQLKASPEAFEDMRNNYDYREEYF
jgi:erythronate-4-phosphate dehydrogenase